MLGLSVPVCVPAGAWCLSFFLGPICVCNLPKSLHAKLHQASFSLIIRSQFKNILFWVASAVLGASAWSWSIGLGPVVTQEPTQFHHCDKNSLFIYKKIQKLWKFLVKTSQNMLSKTTKILANINMSYIVEMHWR